MLYKLRQQLKTHNKTPNSQLPNKRSRTFILNNLRAHQLVNTLFALRAATGFTKWLHATSETKKAPRFRAECFITGRSRGTSQRFTIARTKIKELSGKARLFGVRKASW